MRGPLPCTSKTPSDIDFVARHREIWSARPELRAVYGEFFRSLLAAVGARSPVVELGSGPGFLKEFCPDIVATDVIPSPWIDVVCDGCRLPFRSGSIGAFALVDVLHHLPQPLAFLEEVRRALAPGGRLAMIEPWITPASYLLYRYFHHEDCTLAVDVRRPFSSPHKKAYDGNAAIPLQVVRHLSRIRPSGFTLVRREPFLGLSYLATLGFQRARPLPAAMISAAGRFERLLGAVGRWNATRALLVWEKAA